jgi:hypothetical protein
MSTRDGGNSQIYTMTSGGSNQTRFATTGLQEVHPRFSRNGQKITFARHVLDDTGFNLQVFVRNINGANETQLTSTGANSNPEFSPDGNRIFFNSNRDGNTELYSMAIDGTNQVRMTVNASLDIAPTVQGAFDVETVAVYRPATGQWVLSTENAPSIAISIFFGGQPGDLPVAGNWDGDTRTDIGVFRNGTFHLALLKFLGGHIVLQELAPITFGQAGDLPLAGDWDGDGKDDVGVFRPGATGRFLLRQPVRISTPFNTTIIITIPFDFGTSGDLPMAGDWDGDGDDSAGVYRPADPGQFLITNTNSSNVDAVFSFGGPTDLPLAGDWLGTGRDGVGLLLTQFNTLVLDPSNSGKPGLIFPFGQSGDMPVAGSWLP